MQSDLMESLVEDGNDLVTKCDIEVKADSTQT